MFRSFCAVAALVCCVGALRAEVSVGQPAPDFTLTGSDGKTYQLKNLAGKTVVVAWFPKAFTGGCTAECKSLKENGEMLKQFDVVYFTASCDTVADNTKFAESLMLDYPILSDPTRETAKAYGLVADAKGNAKRVTFIIGPDGKIADMETKVNTKEHAKQLVEKLTALKTPLKK